jgi:phosphoribosylaminoimidazolecarboxamide formyltransferase/IMP cyclohydrolase
MLKIAVFASGGGTNLQALIDACSSRRICGEIVLMHSSRAEAGAVKRAQEAGIETLVKSPSDFDSADAYNAFIAAACRKANVDLVCLAGHMLKIEAPMLNAYPGRILNIHPALLPAFGGKGMYGNHVHEAVVKAGVKFSGCTIHLVDAIYDHGAILAQSTVPVLPEDTAGTLARRVLDQEHWLYPEVVRMFADGRVEIKDGRATLKGSHKEESPRIRRAVLSVSDKTGIVEFAKGLEELGAEIVSTSGTARMLREAGVEVRSLDSMTGFPEILDGRVKTLHPKIHGGILLRRSDPNQAKEATQHGLEPIDMVVVNLYPFEKVAAKATSPYAREVLENIDIGGVTLIRAAAKNFEDVAVVVSPKDYGEVLKELAGSSGQLTLESRRKLALEGFKHTARYDQMISSSWDQSTPVEKAPSSERFPKTLNVELKRVQSLRYGENPHQNAALYVRAERGGSTFEQIQGKELSYNNLLDAFGTWDCVSEFTGPAAVVFKHVTPSGVGTGTSQLEAFDRAWASDPVSAFGGILAVNQPFTLELAERLGKRFLEVIVAPDYEPKALEKLAKKKNLRVIKMTLPPTRALQLRSLGEEVLVTDPDRMTFGDGMKVVTKRKPSKEEEEALRFAWIACKHVKSNAIVLANQNATVGIGAGQMSRVDSVGMAGVKLADYKKDNPAPETLVMASDAFFPFRDGIDAAIRYGISAIIQPGGSIRDEEVIAAADENDLAMVLTGMRHFRH